VNFTQYGKASTTRGGFFTRVLHLIDDPQGEHLAPCAATSIPAPTMKEKAPAIKLAQTGIVRMPASWKLSPKVTPPANLSPSQFSLPEITFSVLMR
jgi:hypothetical protein